MFKVRAETPHEAPLTQEQVDELAKLVIANLEARRRHELPDQWYWADTLLMAHGYFVTDTTL